MSNALPSHHPRKEREPITHVECFLLHTLKRLLRVLECVRFIGDALQFSGLGQLREGKAPLRR